MVAVFVAFDPASRALYYGDEALAGLRALGCEVRLNERSEILDAAALTTAARGCEVIVADRRTAAPAAVFAACPDLVVLMRCAVDIRNVDIDAAGAHGVLVTRASAGFGNAVAEWVIGALVDLARGTSASVHAWRSGGTPAISMGRELRGGTLGIVGYGHIGRRVAELALALGMRVLVHDPHVDVGALAVAQDSAAEDGAAGDGAAGRLRAASLEALLAASDHVVCLAPATAATENLFDAHRFAQMRPGAVFVNPSRGNLVDEAALLAALDRGHLAGAALDVGRAPDQMPSPALARHPRVVATPHIGGLTPQAASHQALETVAQLAALLRGEMPAGAVDPARATRLARLHTRAATPP